MKKTLIVVYDTDKELHGLIVANPDKVLENGNIEIINIIVGSYADEIFQELTKGESE